MDDHWTPPDLRLRVAYAYRSRRQIHRRPWLAGTLAGCVAALVLTLGILGGQALAPQASQGLAPRPARLAAPVVQLAGCNQCNIALPVRYATLQGRKVPLSLVREVAYDLAAREPISAIGTRALPEGWPSQKGSMRETPLKGGELYRTRSLGHYGLQAVEG